MIVDKPSGLLTIPTPKNEPRTLISILNDDAVQRGLAYRFHPCHRLDRETSGLVVFAKGKGTQGKMMDLFKARQVHKKYIAFSQGYPAKDEGVIKSSIMGVPSETRYKIIEKRKDFAILEVTPVTGRTNQIRIHFKHIGHPLVGESKFAFRKDYNLRAKRVCLHAAQLRFKHPATGKELTVEADLAPDLKNFLEKNLNLNF